METRHPFEHQRPGRRRSHERRPALKLVHSSDREAALPAVEYGSGWYHDEAISHANEVTSHRCM